jgi:DUF1680 family protein
MTKKTNFISHKDVLLDGGFWQQKQKLIEETTIYAVMDRFKETGRFDAFKFDWKEGQPNKPHCFWDSDIAKWIESAAYILDKKDDPILEAAVDELVDLIEKNQDENGYFNIYYTVVEPDKRWTDRNAHELYTAGHLIEAAVAYYHATGKDKFLKLMCRFADHIEQVFKIEQSAAFVTPGHEEIELALVKLYRCTNEKRYLDLAKFFIDNRGSNSKDQYGSWANSRYTQSHLPVRQQTTAEGHAVRAVYLYSGMADLAYEYDDKTLFNACRTIFDNIVQKRMYITGGIGSSAQGEAFTIDYDLPNLTAYSESCAAIGLVLFAKRMMRCDNEDAVYADIIERVIYNGFLSSISLDGKSFFYENPLEIQPELIGRDKSVSQGGTRLPITQRLEVFNCSCCPPNITRFIASIGEIIYTFSKDTLFINQYIKNKTKATINGADTKLELSTEYPVKGRVKVSVSGGSFSRIAFRIPSWCENFSISLNGQKVETQVIKGYAYLDYDHALGAELEIDFKMQVELVEASPYVQENSGRVAVQYGPVVYCLEGVDNGSLLRNIRLSKGNVWTVEYSDYFNANVLKTRGWFKVPPEEGRLYYKASNRMKEKSLQFIPYFGFANRGESEMVVWVLGWC